MIVGVRCVRRLQNVRKKLDKRGKVKFVSFRDEDVVEKYELSQELQSKMEQRLYILKIISGMTAFIAYMY